MAEMPECTERVARIWGKRNVYKVSVLKPERQRTLGRPLKNSIEIYLK